MGDKSGIEWTDATWNPVTGCSHESEGCRHCYAETLAKRLHAMGQPGYTDLPWTAQNAAVNVQCHPNRLAMPLRWTRPRMIFVNGELRGALGFGRPESTRCNGWYGSVDDVRAGRAVLTRRDRALPDREGLCEQHRARPAHHRARPDAARGIPGGAVNRLHIVHYLNHII